MNYEIIKYNENLPFKVIILNMENQSYHWHKEMELVFLLKGSLTFEVKGKKHKVVESDLFFVNSFDAHSITAEKDENILLALQFDPIFFDEYYPQFSSFYYEPNNALSDKSNPLYSKITKNLAELMLSIIKLKDGYKLKALTSVSEIVSILIENFKTEKQLENNNELYKEKRVSDILSFIEDNYSDELSLNSIAEEVSLTPKHVSRFFKNTFGVSFVDYVNKFRITKSLNDLLNSKKSIIDISIEYGFNDHKSYNRVFKKHHNMTPTEYRNLYSNIYNTDSSQALNNGYFYDNSSNYFKYLFEFLNQEKNNLNSNSNIYDKVTLNLDVTNLVGKNFNKNWNKIASGGRASLCLRKEFQTQIRTAKKEIGFEYIRFHGIFSDELVVYNEDANGNPIYNWIFIDAVLDFLDEINLKPFIEIGFMPEALASKKQHGLLSWNPNVSYPKSLKKWGNLVYEFVKHCTQRYGEDEVEKWYFQVWSAPEIPNAFWHESQKKYFEFYKETYFAVKKLSNKLKVGSPGFLPTNDFQWLKDFLDYCKSNSIILDFAASHIYSYIYPENKPLPAKLMSLSKISPTIMDKEFLDYTLRSFKEKVEESKLNNMELLVTEWNLSPFTNDYIRDTCFLSTYIIDNVLKNIDNIDKIAFWSLTDIIGDGISENKLFHGGLGLLSYNGIKKPSYNAFFLLNKLGDKIIDHKEDYILTSKGSNYQILIYNCTFFDELFKSGDKSLLSYHNRYNIFDSAQQNKNVNIILTLPSGDYKIKRYILNRESGSSFDAWLEMGAPELIEPDVYNYLKACDSPKITVTAEAVKKQLVLEDNVPVHGVLLIEIDKL